MVKITNILKGFTDYLVNINPELAKERINICKTCPLCTKTSLGLKCNNNIYMNTETKEIRMSPKKGFKNGCGCILEAKSRVEDETCPLGKWN